MTTPPAPTPLSYDQQRLAAARTHMANERTLLTYVRTSLALLAFGLTLLQLHPGRGRGVGLGAIGMGLLVLLVGWLRYRYRARQIEECRVALPPRSC